MSTSSSKARPDTRPGASAELHLSAQIELLETELELGRHSQLVGELELLVAAHPYQERLRGLLMLALYRSGRQAEALHAYQDARRVLSDELGLEPEQELRDLETAHPPTRTSVLSAGARERDRGRDVRPVDAGDTGGRSFASSPRSLPTSSARRRSESAFLRTRSRRSLDESA